MLLKSSQNSQENTCVRVAWVCNFIKNKTLTQVDFPVNFEKFLRTHFLQNTSRRLLLLVLDLYTMLAKWWVLQFVGIDGIIKLSNDWEVSVFNEIFVIFFTYALSYKLSWYVRNRSIYWWFSAKLARIGYTLRIIRQMFWQILITIWNAEIYHLWILLPSLKMSQVNQRSSYLKLIIVYEFW